MASNTGAVTGDQEWGILRMAAVPLHLPSATSGLSFKEQHVLPQQGSGERIMGARMSRWTSVALRHRRLYALRGDGWLGVWDLGEWNPLP